MPNNYTDNYQVTYNGKTYNVPKNTLDKQGWDNYAQSHPGATLRMRDKNNADYDVPFADISRMQQKGGLRPYNFRVTHKQRSTQRRTAQPSNNLSQRITQRSAQRPASQSAPMVAQPAAAPADPSTPTTNYTGPIAKQEPFKGLDVEPAVEYNQKTGSFTKSNKHKYTSEVKPTAKKQSTTPLQDAIADKERISKMMEARMRELEQQQQDMPWWQQLGSAGKTGMGADMNYEAISNSGLLNDDEYIKLQAAYNEADRRIRNLQALQNKDGFWASLGRNLKRRDLWDNGITDFTTGMGKLRAKTGPKNDKSESTQELLKQEAAADAAEQQADQELGDAARWGRMAAESASYTPYFIQFGGIMNVASKAGAKAATNIAERLGAKGLMRTVTKGTGKVLGDVGGSLGLTVGPQALRTSSDAIDRYVGHVDVDDDGNFTYTGGKSAGQSVYEGIANSTIENFTELVFDGMPGVADVARGGLAKLGLKGASRWIDKATGSQLYKASQKMLRRAGVGNLTGEIAEEEINIPLNALFVGDNSFSDLLDKDQQKDIVGGVALSTALMHGVSLAAQGAGRGLSAAAYARYMHNLNKADSKAAELIGDEWEGMKESLDQSTNDEWAKALSRITNRSDLTDEQKIAAVDYANRLVQQRGYNLGQNAASEKGLQNPVEQSASEAYLNGMEENDPSNLSKIVINLDKSRKEVAEKLGINEDEVDDELNDPVNYMNTHPNADKQAIVNYANGKAAYDGMIQQQKYRIDDAVSQNENLIDSHTNKDTGMITRASLKAKDDSGNDKQVYIIGGTVNMMEDGSGIDKDKSSGSVIVIDENGEQSMISPIEILSLDASIDPVEEKKVTSDAIREQMASEFETLINSYINQPATEQATKTYNPGDELAINDESGNPIGAEIISQADENGRYLVRSESPINGNVVNSFTADEINNLTGGQQSSETPVEEQPANMAPAVQENENSSVPESKEAEPVMESVEDNTEQAAVAEPSAATPLEPATQEPSALSRIPIDENGEPAYEQADAETAWDAIMEQTEGDENDAREVINSMIADKENELKKLEKSKPKAGTTISQKIAAQKEHKAVVQQARDALKKWQDIAAIPDRRASMAREEAQKAAKAESEARRIAAEAEKAKQEEEARKQREALNGVPDYVQDTPTEARARGYRRVNGEKIDRQEPISTPMGKEIEVKFSDNEKPKGRVAVIDSAQLQPSHLNGTRNPLHFIDEAQPKERNDEASRLAAQKIASDIRPEEITYSTTAYTGAPTVNTRGEVIQGNNRSIALRDMWAEYPEQAAKYKQYLMEHAQDYGLNAEDIANMDSPVLVNMIDVPDDQAIQLGQYVAQDTESGGVERIKPQNAVRKIGKDMNIFAGLLLNSNNDETTFSELLDANGLDALKWLNKKGIITDTQYKSAFDSKGNVNAEAKNDLKQIMYQSIFQGASPQLEEMFNALPAKAQRAILATAYRDYDSPKNERLVPEIQQSIMAYYALQQYESFAQAKNYKEAMTAAQDWRRQTAFDDVTGESYLPSERFSNFALLMAVLYKGQTQSLIQQTYNNIFDQVQGKQQATLFDTPDNTPKSLNEAIDNTLNQFIPENGKDRSNVLASDSTAGRSGEPGSERNTETGRRSENESGTNTDTGGTESNDAAKIKEASKSVKTKPFAKYKSVKPTENETKGYTIDERFHKKRGMNIYAVKFEEQMPRDKFVSLKSQVKQFGGYYSSYGKGGFIFQNKDDAQQFAEAVMDPSGEMLEDAKPLSLSDAKEIGPKQIDVIGLMQDVQDKGTANLSDHVINEEQKTTEKENDTNAYGSQNKLVSRARYDELKKRMKEKLNQLNFGMDPELLEIGLEMTAYHLEAGSRKFSDYAKAMINDLGDAIRPYLKSFYNYARDYPEVIDAGLAQDMTPSTEVEKLDVANFDKNSISALDAAETVVKEQTIKREAEKTKEELIETRNNNRRKKNEQISANTESIVSQTETIASDAESRIEKAETEEEVNNAIKDADKHLQAIDDQLSALDYIDNLHSGMRVVLKDGKNVMLSIVMHSGEQISATQMSAPRIERLYGSYSGELIEFTPDNIDVDATIKLNEPKNEQTTKDNNKKEKKSYNGYKIGDKVTFTPQNKKGKSEEATIYDFESYGSHKPVLDTGLAPVLYEVVEWNEIKHIDLKENTKKQENNPDKIVSSQQQNKAKIADLFANIEQEEEVNNDYTESTGSTETTSGSNRTVGDVPAGGNRVLGTNGSGENNTGDAKTDTAGQSQLDNGERSTLSEQRSGRGDETVTDGSSKGQPELPDGGRSLRTGNTQAGRKAESGENTGYTQTDTGKESNTEDRKRNRTEADIRTRSESGRGKVSEQSSKKSSSPRTKENRRDVRPLFKRNFVYTNTDVDKMTPSERIKANVSAIEVLRDCLTENRSATPEEQEILSKYRGWGGIEGINYFYTTGQMRYYTGRNSEQFHKLADLIDELDPKGRKNLLGAIRNAALTSYYTPLSVASAMNNFLVEAGFNGGSLLDPSMGNGIFEGTLKKSVQQRTVINGVELDWLTGQIAHLLYPDANIQINGFENTSFAPNSQDVVISNIPFGSFGVSDTRYERSGVPAQKSSVKKIHNYFAVRMVDSTRPGGLTVIMTSNAIMDTQGNQIIRDYMADNAEILGIIRLPDNTFKVAGTSVVTDVIFLRKFKDNTDRENVLSNPDYKINVLDPFRQTGKTNLKSEKDGQNYDVAFNSYFTHNPNMMIGTPSAGGQYRNDGFTLKSSLNHEEIGQEMGKIISEKIIGQRKGKLFDTVIPEREINEAVKQDYVGDGDYIGNGNIVEQNGKLGILRQESNQYGEKKSTFVENPEFDKNAERIKAMFPLRKAMKKRIADEINDEPEEVIRKDMEELQSAYDQFVQKYGRLNDRKNNFLTEDIDGYSLRALEIWETDEKNKPSFSHLSDLFTKMTIKHKIKVDNIKNPQEAIAISLATYGEIRPSFMNDTLGEDWQQQCGDTLFEIPNTNGLNFVTRDEYLSGDVKTKLQEAEEAAKIDKKFERNVNALKEVQPADLSFNEINVQMGARWVPVEIYNQFLQDVLGVYSYSKNTGVTYARDIDTYTVLIDKSELGGAAERWGTDRKSPAEIFEAALKDQTLSVYDNVKDPDGTIKRVFNLAASEEANEKVRDLREEFQNWLPRDIKRVEELTQIYNDTFHRNVLRKFDGSHLNVPGLMGKEPRPHQKNATWMLICNRGGIVDHIVGAGKTLVMQMAIMEMRRMGIAKKPMIVALKATTAQIAKEFRESFPAARVLAPTEKDFSSKNRKKFLSNIAQNDWDCVILSHEQYVQLPHTQEIETLVINEQLEQLNNTLEYLYGTGDSSKLTKRQIKGLQKRKNNLQSRLKSMTERRVDREFTFENLGVDYLFVDECQAFKNLPYTTSYNNVAGLSDANGSQRAIALLNGVRYLQQKHQGDYGTTFLSGTTITNSLVEIYNLLQYLRPSELNRLGMNTFDAWASTFAERSSELEYGVTNQLKEKNRFRKFSNVSELSQMYAEMADVRNDLNLKLPKPKAKVHIVAVPASEALQEINDQVVEMVKTQNGSYFGIPPREKQPWGLLASNISTKAAISVKLIDPTLEEDKGKIYYVCENVKKVYDKFNDQKGCQLIFCDTGVPGANKAYDAYSDIIDKLVNQYGIPRKEIADIHEADTDEKRKALFQKVREGKVRILIGGTKNMGTGVNVQDRIVAMHHVDVPWTPADREQREGRGVRQGNIIARDYNDNKVDIYFYAAEGSLDMYKYQLQDIKGKMFAQFKTGTVGEREFDEGSEDEDGSFDAAAVVAILSGNPVILEKSKQDKLVERLRRSKRNYETDWQRRKKIYDDLQISKKNYDRLVKENKRDVDYLTEKGFVPNEKGVYPSNVSVSYVSRYNTEGTKEFDKPKEAGAYIHSLLKSKKKVVLSGYGIKAEIALDENDINGLFTTPQYLVSTGLKSNIKYSVPLSDDDTNAGLAFRSLLQKAIKNQEIYANKYAEVKNKLEGADPGPNEFPKQKELDEAIAKKKELDDAYKALSESEENLREGNGPITDDELSYENDPIAKVLGKSTRSAKQRKSFAERERRNMINTLQELADKLNLNNVEFVTDASTLSGRKARAKGFYSRDTGKITIVIPNHTSVQDAVQTLLHEAVAHYGLRKLFGENFDNFLDNVFNNAEPDVRERIVNLASKRGWDFRTATEEYLASLAENTNFENIDPSWWMRIKQFFLDMLNKLGLKGFNQVPLSDNELRYILWRSYQNLSHPEYYNTIFGEAEDIAKQNELKVGNYAPTEIQAQTVAEESIVDTNRRFNEKLRQQIDGNLPKGHVYELGRPGRVLRSTGIPDLPIELAASRLGKKASKDYESNHPFELESVMDLPKAIQHPIAVFESKTKAGSKVIMVELKDRNGNNFVVAMNTNVPKNRFSKASIQINDIRSIYPKDNVKDIVNWINRGDLLRYADKKKIEDWITQQRSNSAEVEIQNLDVAAKVVENFKNPNIEEENNNLLFRDGDETSPLSGSTIDAWDKLANSFKFQLRETSVDYLTAVEKFQQLIEKSSGKKIQDYENAYDYMTFLSSKNRQEMDMFDSFIVKPINKAISNLVGKKHTIGKWTWEKGPLRELVMYVEAKHGTDRNRQMAVENSINDFKAPNLEFFENAGIGFDMNVYKQELEEAGKTAYDAAYEKAREKMNEETPEAEENAKKKAELAELKAKEVFADKKMQQLNEQYREKQYNDWMQAKETINSTEGLSWKDKQDMLDEEAHKLNADLLRDYSGLSSVFGDKEKYTSGWLESAKNYVTEYESSHPEENIKQLWNTIGSATRYALEKQYETGLVSADYVRRQRQRFDNYIPLRGFEDEIAGDVYKYIGSEFYPGSNPVKTAHGRTSEAGNPFGSILNTAYSSISVGNKNMAKMAFYSLVVNHDTGGLAVANRAWMVKYDALKNDPELEDLLVMPQSDGNEETTEWVEAVPKMADGLTASEMKDVLDRFDKAMKKGQREEITKPIGKKANIAYRTLYKERNEHDMPLFISGDKYVITITGNPRVAQSMNGLLNPDVDENGLAQMAKKIQQFMAGAFTSKNAAFSIANLAKDTIYSNNQTFIRENPLYWLKFTINQKAGFGAYPKMMEMLFKYQRGTLDVSKKIERDFYSFMKNGGATGYTFVNSQEEYARELSKKLKEISKNTSISHKAKKVIQSFFDLVEFAGQSAELVNRFAAYQTSRQMGRSVNRAIRDAKEITVNFNRKGAGRKTVDKNKPWYSPINILSALSQYGRTSILFWNANMQAKYRFYLNMKEHPIKTSATLIGNSMAFAAVLLPLINNLLLPALYSAFGLGGDDDDDDYFNALTDWERTHNMCVRLPNGNWLKVPLSPEMSPWFTMGDAIGGQLSGQRDFSSSDFIKSSIDAVSPLSINWSYGNDAKILLNILPTVSQPILQNMMNVNFMGNPIKKTPFNYGNSFMPEFLMTYRSASPSLVELSRLSNLAGGGTEKKTSGNLSDWNPSMLQNLITGYTGGFGQTFLSAADWIVNTSKGESQAITFSRMPLASRFFISGNKDVKISRINSRYYDVRNFLDEFEFDKRSYEKSIQESERKHDMIDLAQNITEYQQLMRGSRAVQYVQLKEYDNAIRQYERYLKLFPDDEASMNQYNTLKAQAVKVYDEIKQNNNGK